jgi:16S rRNA (guanine(966)-N(2))-methyltransferase RsmD
MRGDPVMRVIAGSARGVKLAAPVGLKTRPTADRVKEALFSIISSRCGFENSKVLDLCAGTGGLGIESLSRGASSCCFVEQDRSVIQILKQNLVTTGFADRSDCVQMEVIKALQQQVRCGNVFDIVFFDPPYSSDLYTAVIEALSLLSLMSEEGLLVAECSSRIPLADRYGKYERIDRRIYGDTALEFFVRESQ